jgi:hypothetical protein
MIERPTRAVLLVAAVLVARTPAVAQRPTRPPPGARPPAVPLAYSFSPVDSSTRHIPPTYWLEGAIAGGATLGFLGAILFVDLCNFDGPCGNSVAAAAGGLVLGGLTGFGIGAMIGGQFPKHSYRVPLPR